MNWQNEWVVCNKIEWIIIIISDHIWCKWKWKDGKIDTWITDRRNKRKEERIKRKMRGKEVKKALKNNSFQKGRKENYHKEVNKLKLRSKIKHSNLVFRCKPVFGIAFHLSTEGGIFSSISTLNIFGTCDKFYFGTV